jgi:hypothetical protein
MTMSNESFDRWVEALRSGKYEQGKGQLKTAGGAFCCLGLFCELEGFDLAAPWKDEWVNWGTAGGTENAPGVLRRAMNENQRNDLAIRNDRGDSFSQIADVLEARRDEYVVA